MLTLKKKKKRNNQRGKQVDDGGQGKAVAEVDEEADTVYAQRPKYNSTPMSSN